MREEMYRFVDSNNLRLKQDDLEYLNRPNIIKGIEIVINSFLENKSPDPGGFPC